MEHSFKDLTESQLEFRQKVLSLLMSKFPNRNLSIYKCADDWCEKFKTTAGLVKYYETYYQ